MDSRKIPTLKPGDIILARSGDWISGTIRWFSKRRTGSARFSHAALALGNMHIVPSVIEAITRIRINPLKKYRNQPIIIYRNKHLTSTALRSVVTQALTITNQGYAWLKLPLFAFDALFKTYWFTQYLGITNFKVCSNLIAWVYYATFKGLELHSLKGFSEYTEMLDRFKSDKVFGINWRSTSPDTIDDWCVTHSDEWEVVYRGKGVGNVRE